MVEVFLDSSYAIALASKSDLHHEKAVALADRLEREGRRLITTRAVILEIGNALAGHRYRKEAAKLLSSLESDPSIEIVPLSEGLYVKGFSLFRDRSDKEWGLTDCIAFVLMKEKKSVEALTADDHYRQAGFRALLLEA
jgi:hypothetical protein